MFTFRYPAITGDILCAEPVVLTITLDQLTTMVLYNYVGLQFHPGELDLWPVR